MSGSCDSVTAALDARQLVRIAALRGIRAIDDHVIPAGATNAARVSTHRDCWQPQAVLHALKTRSTPASAPEKYPGAASTPYIVQ